jgi:hypothetical protein
MITLENYSDFMIFDLLDTGHRKRLDISEKEFIDSKAKELLINEAVILIVKEEIRRIYIWKGISSNVRKKFIASRVASKLQKELVEEAHFHRCKIVSIDQGDESKEFLQTFNIKPSKIKNQDIKVPIYQISNEISESLSKSGSQTGTLGFSTKNIQKKQKLYDYTPQISPLNTNIKNAESLQKRELNSFINQKVPKGYERKHLLLGRSNLYGIVKKKSEVFGEVVEEKDWEVIEDISDEIIELEGHKLRIHFDKEDKSVLGIEILERISFDLDQEQSQEKRPINLDFKRWTLNALRKFCSEHNINISSSNKKAEIIKILEEKFL